MLIAIRFVLLFLAFLSVGFLYYFSDKPEYRYREFPCNYHMAYETTGDVALAGIGGSRMKVSFGAEQISREIEKISGEASPVFNISHNRKGMDLEFVLIRDFLEQHSTDVMFVFYEPRQKPTPHVQYFSAAKTTDFRHLLFADRNKSIFVRISDTLKLFSTRFDRWKKVNVRTRLIRSGDNFYDCHSSDMLLNVDKVVSGGEVIPADTIAPDKMDITSNDDAYQIYFMKRITKLGNMHGTKMVFIHLPFRNKSTMSDQFQEDFFELIGAPLWVLPPSLRDELAYVGYRDNTHLYAPGRDIYIDWLVKKLERNCYIAEVCLNE